MPLWIIHHSAGTLSVSDKKILAKGITKIYTDVGLPPFYVNTLFKEASPGDIFIGEEPHKKFATVAIRHIARSIDSEELRLKFLSKVDEVLTPFMEAKQMDWEYHCIDGPRNLWKTNGIIPPETGSAEEKKWAELNRAVPYY
ncbi:hypothetical protein V500_07308 [Pseudogymnoascus sp. VKM F-4518 (FW-2643)]|nr:hypothetical protein V500_07308 [Pseudogymnoascus sp. VKM F-4518 (FW-2643)]